MKLRGINIGFVITGSFSLFEKAIELIKRLIKEEAIIIPIMSYNAYKLDTKYGKAKDFIEKIQEYTRKRNYTYNSRS